MSWMSLLSSLCCAVLLSLDFSGVPNRLRNCPASVREPDPDPLFEILGLHFEILSAAAPTTFSFALF